MTVYTIDLGWERSGEVIEDVMETLDNLKEYYNEEFYQRAFSDFSKAKKLAEEVIEDIAQKVEGHDGIGFGVDSETLYSYELSYETKKGLINFYVFINVVEVE